MKTFLRCGIVICLTTTSLAHCEVVRRWPAALEVHTEVMKLEDFTGLFVQGGAAVTVIQGDRNELTLQGSSVILSRTKVNIEAGDLKIITDKSWHEFFTFWAPKLTCTLMVKDLNKATTASGAQLKLLAFSTRTLDLEVRDFGRIEAEAHVGSLTSFIDASGQIIVSGSADKEFVVIGGAGMYQARDLRSKECKVDVYRLGTAYVNVSDTLDATIQGDGKIYYRGNPKHVYQNISKSGQLIPR